MNVIHLFLQSTLITACSESVFSSSNPNYSNSKREFTIISLSNGKKNRTDRSIRYQIPLHRIIA